MQDCRQVLQVTSEAPCLTHPLKILYCAGKPVIGNLLDIPPKHSWLKFKDWADQYGPIFRLSIFGRNLVVVSTEKIANDLLRDRGNLYSSREQLPMAAQLMSRNLRPLFLPYGGETDRSIRMDAD